MDKIEPAVRSAVEAGRSAMTGEWRNCRCQCRTAHPADSGVCDVRRVITRRSADADVSLCAPCAVAQGVAEMKLYLLALAGGQGHGEVPLADLGGEEAD